MAYIGQIVLARTMNIMHDALVNLELDSEFETAIGFALANPHLGSGDTGERLIFAQHCLHKSLRGSICSKTRASFHEVLIATELVDLYTVTRNWKLGESLAAETLWKEVAPVDPTDLQIAQLDIVMAQKKFSEAEKLLGRISKQPLDDYVFAGFTLREYRVWRELGKPVSLGSSSDLTIAVSKLDGMAVI